MEIGDSTAVSGSRCRFWVQGREGAPPAGSGAGEAVA